MPTTWYVVAALGAVAAVAVLVKPDLLHRLSPTQPQDPGDDDREASGADEQFAGELHAMKHAPVAPELISDTEMDLQWALVWHDCEHRWQAEVDRIFTEAQAELRRPRTFDEVRELVTA